MPHHEMSEVFGEGLLERIPEPAQASDSFPTGNSENALRTGEKAQVAE